MDREDVVTMEILGTKTFCAARTLQEQAFKVCEEAFELYQAVKHLDDVNDFIDEHARRWAMIDECADVTQAALNFFAMLGFDEDGVFDAMDECYRRNRHRGRVE